jgi:hypothetical protein
VLCRGYNDTSPYSDVAKRTLLDLNGYELIARLIFFHQPTKYRSVLWVLEKSTKDSMCFKSLLFKRFFSKEETFIMLCTAYRYLFDGVGFSMKFWLCNILYKLPFLRTHIKNCLAFIRNKILKRKKLVV